MACNNRSHSRGRVAFSWENKPGVCKVAVAPPHRLRDDGDLLKKQLQPPPCTPARKGNNKKMQRDVGVEDPFLAAYRECTNGDDEKNCTPARKGNNKKMQRDVGVEDPFLAAYRECTNGDDEKNCKLKKNKSGFGGWMTMNLFGNLSCKHLTAVRDDSLIRSHVSKRTV